VEAELDLFSEQALWPALFECLLTAYDILTGKGYPAEAVALELYASGEAADIFRAMAEKGLFEQMRFHSPTSQYGVLSRQPGATGDHELLAARMRQSLEYIRSGQFAQEWTREQQAGYPIYGRLRSQAWNHPINRADQDVRRLLEPGRSACAQVSS
jgi:ketol-acid reductoisomerase